MVSKMYYVYETDREAYMNLGGHSAISRILGVYNDRESAEKTLEGFRELGCFEPRVASTWKNETAYSKLGCELSTRIDKIVDYLEGLRTPKPEYYYTLVGLRMSLDEACADDAEDLRTLRKIEEVFDPIEKKHREWVQRNKKQTDDDQW